MREANRGIYCFYEGNVIDSEWLDESLIVVNPYEMERGRLNELLEHHHSVFLFEKPKYFRDSSEKLVELMEGYGRGYGVKYESSFGNVCLIGTNFGNVARFLNNGHGFEDKFLFTGNDVSVEGRFRKKYSGDLGEVFDNLMKRNIKGSLDEKMV